ncbi:MAG TPA: DUF5819 family protein [Bacteroidia bacterium]|nr:DUF5819 family protein [Bacteroidia bacterium]
MNRKRILFLGGALIFLLHFFFTAAYSFPGLAGNRFLQRVTGHYMFPLFNQDWKIFAPDPPVFSKKLFYRAAFSDGTSSGWTDPGAELLEKHYRNRFGNCRDRFAIYEAMGREMEAGEDSLPLKYVLNDCASRFGAKKISIIECCRVYVSVPEFKTGEGGGMLTLDRYFKKDLRENH